MPIAAQHHAKINHNRDFVSFLKTSSSPFNDWVITGMFYIALHQIECYLDEKIGHHCNTHSQRHDWMSRTADLNRIWYDYRELYDKSMDARYGSATMTADDVSEAEECLEAIESQIESLL